MDFPSPKAVSNSAQLPGYAELHCLSNFSFQRGASRPEELVARARALGYAALAITDECSMAGVVRAHVEAKAPKFKSALGWWLHRYWCYSPRVRILQICYW